MYTAYLLYYFSWINETIVNYRYESESNRETLPVPDTDSDSDHKELPSRKPFKAKAKLPRKPTPYFLYHNSRMKDLKAKGKSRDETLKICTRDYFAMHDDEKLNWILLALEETPAYLASYLSLSFFYLSFYN